jgi:hypothetical protein
MLRLFLEILKKKHKRLKEMGFKKVLPLFYILLLFIGAILTFVYAFIPSFVACSSIFGSYFCTPMGIFIALIVSLPGYIISGNALIFMGDLPWGISFLVVIATSVLFYYFLGLAIDGLRGKPMNAENLSKIFIIVIFSILFIFFVSLL